MFFRGEIASLASASNLELTSANAAGFLRNSLVTKSSTELRGWPIRQGAWPRGAVRFEYVPNDSSSPHRDQTFPEVTGLPGRFACGVLRPKRAVHHSAE